MLLSLLNWIVNKEYRVGELDLRDYGFLRDGNFFHYGGMTTFFLKASLIAKSVIEKISSRLWIGSTNSLDN